MVRPKAAKQSLSEGIEDADNVWHELLEVICKVNAFNTPNSPLVRSKEFIGSIHDTFEYFWKSRNVMMVTSGITGQITKQKNELRDSVSHLQVHINNLKASQSALQGNLLSCSHRAEVAENQTPALILQLAE